jgi:hypothetical protein
MLRIETSKQPRGADVRLPILVLSLLAALQAVLVLVTGTGVVTKVMAVGLALLGFSGRLRTLWVLTALIVLNLFVHLARITPPFPYRLADVAVLALYTSAALAGLAAAFFEVRFATALAATTTLAVMLVASEMLIERFMPPNVVSPVQIAWSGTPQSDPGLGDVYPPYAVMRSVYPDNPRGYFMADRAAAASTSRSQYSVTYSLNALGCRGHDYAIPRPHGRGRILVLGNSTAFGVGVHEADTFAARLERSLAGVPARAGSGYDVINCGTRGYGTREQRLFYEQIASRYEPDVLLLTMTDADNLSRRDELRLGYQYEHAKYESLLLSARMLRYARHEGRRPYDYSGVQREVSVLAGASNSHGTRLVVVLFGSADLSLHWTEFTRTVAGKLGESDIPALDLGPALVKDSLAEDLRVHDLDLSPNEVAHRVATDEIERFLRRSGLVG